MENNFTYLTNLEKEAYTKTITNFLEIVNKYNDIVENHILKMAGLFISGSKERNLNYIAIDCMIETFVVILETCKIESPKEKLLSYIEFWD